MKELGRWWGSRELSWWRGEGEGGWRKEASKVVRHTNNKATQHIQGSHFSKGKMSCFGWDSTPQHSRQSTILAELRRQLMLHVHVAQLAGPKSYIS